MIVRIVLVGSVLATLLAIPKVQAVEPLSVAEFAKHCKHYTQEPDSKDGIFCVRYIQGFIDGAVATDERVTQNVAAEFEKSETFSERATRIRGRRLSRFSTFYAEFCLGKPVPLKEVVKKVVKHLEGREFTDESLHARGVVYHVLRKEFPCKDVP